MAFLVYVPAVLCCGANLLSDYLDAQRIAAHPLESQMASEIVKLNSDISKLSPVADFVAVSLKKREVGKLEKSLALLKTQNKQQTNSKPDIGRIVRWGILPGLQFLIFFLFRGHSVALLPSGWFYWFVFGQNGGIGLLAWLVVVSVAVGGATAQFSQLVGLRQLTPPFSLGGFMSSLLSK